MMRVVRREATQTGRRPASSLQVLGSCRFAPAPTMLSGISPFMNTETPLLHRRREQLAGILLMVIGMAFLNAMDAVSKLLTADHHGIQVTWARYAFHLLPLVVLAGPRRLRRMVKTEQPVAQVLRSTSFALSATFIIAAFATLPLTDATAITFIAPFIMVMIGWRFLGEHVGPHRWTAVVVGFGGMLVLVWPSGDVFELGALYAVGAALFWAIGLSMTRLVREEDPWTTLFYTALVGAVLLSLAVPFFWTMPTPTAWGLMLLMGLLGGVAHTLIILAFQRASASLLAPFNYTMLLWMTLYGWLLFGDVPGLRVIVGAAIIVGAGLYAWYREQKTGAPAPAS